MKRILLISSLGITLLVAVSLAFTPVERASTVHNFLVNNIGTMVTKQDNITTNPSPASPARVFVDGADGRFFTGRIVFTVTDDADADSLVPRVVIQVFNGANYVTVIEIDGVDNGSKTSDLPLAGFDPAGTADNQETFRIFLAPDDGNPANPRDTTATIRYVFVAHTQS